MLTIQKLCYGSSIYYCSSSATTLNFYAFYILINGDWIIIQWVILC